MDIRKIKKLIELLEGSNLTELEIREGEETIRLSRAGGAQAVAPPPLTVPVAAPPARTEAVAESDGSELPRGHAITSPMVGTYFAAAQPDSDPFVRVGSRVSAGDTLCIIEAMKIFNQIKSDRAGTVRAVLKNTGEPVEYGETLFVIE